MLKPYHDRNVDVVAAVTCPESDNESQGIDEPNIKPEIVSCKLTNSEVLQNLGDKLSHMEPHQ